MSGNSWGAKHKLGLEIAAAAAATALTAGAASPALAGLLGGTAAAEGAGAAGLGAAAAGTAAADTAAAGLGGGTAALFGPTAGGSALAAEGAAIPSITSAGAAASGMGGGTASLYGGQGLLAGSSPSMFTAGLGAGEGGASLPTFGDKVASGISNVLPGGNDTLSSIKSGVGKLQKAQQAYKTAQGLLGGGQPQGGGAAPARPQSFGQGASPVNFAQMTAQPNMMMQPQGQQLPPQLAMLPPNDPRVLAYLQQMGGMYG
jgi:hypothetical protein